MGKYTLKVSENGTDYDEQVEVDTEKETEIFHVPKISPEKDSGDIIYDFKKNLTMIRVTEAKSCFLSESIANVPKPTDLLQLLELANRNNMRVTPRTEVKFKVVSTLKDRSYLSDEMASLCAKLPIYQITEGEVDLGNLNITDVMQTPEVVQTPAKRTKRGWVCRLVCKTVCAVGCNYICSGLVCNWVCKPVCNYVCNRVCD